MEDFKLPEIFDGLELTDEHKNYIKGLDAQNKGSNRKMTEQNKELETLRTNLEVMNSKFAELEKAKEDKLSDVEKLQQTIENMQKDIETERNNTKLERIKAENTMKAQVLVKETSIPMNFLKPYLNNENFEDSVKDIVEDWKLETAKIIESGLGNTPSTGQGQGSVNGEIQLKKA